MENPNQRRNQVNKILYICTSAINDDLFSFSELRSKGLSVIFIDVLKSVDKTYTIPIKNEIIYNNAYYIFIPLSFSQICNLGQYYDHTKYYFIVFFLLDII